jgi:simple sugar transport system permease protein
MLALVIIAFIVFSVLAPNVFMTGLNLQNMALSVPETGLLAVAMMVAMLTGGIDLSLVGIANLSAITISTTYSALAANNPAMAESMAPALILMGIVVGILAGAVNAWLIAGVGVTPILATLGTMQIYNGVAVVWTGGKTLYGSPEALTAFGQSTMAGIPMLFIVFLAVALLVAFIVDRTPLGLRLELEGANPVAARYSGIRSRNILTKSYLLTGLIGGITGVVFISRNPTASADYGASYILLVIVIAVLGGTNPNGGYAIVSGVFLAALTLQIVSSGFTAMRLSTFHYSIAQGVILIVVLVIDQIDWRRWRDKWKFRNRSDTRKNALASSEPA